MIGRVLLVARVVALTVLALGCRYVRPKPPPPPPPVVYRTVPVTWQAVDPVFQVDGYFLSITPEGQCGTSGAQTSGRCSGTVNQAHQLCLFAHNASGDGPRICQTIDFTRDVAFTAAPTPNPLPPAFPPPPTRDQVINVKASFSNLYDRDGLVINTGYLPSLMYKPEEAGRVRDWLDRLHADGDTHVEVMCWGGDGPPTYHVDGYPGYPLEFVDAFRPDIGLGKCKDALVRLIRDEHLTPVLFMAADGQTHGSGGGYGWSWFVQNVTSVIQQLRELPGPDITNYVLFSPGFELSISLPCGHPPCSGNAGDHTPDQIMGPSGEFVALRRAIGPNAQIASHLGVYINLGHGGLDWVSPGLREVDAVLLEFNGDDARNWPDHSSQNASGCADSNVALYMLGPAVTFTPPPQCQQTAEWYLRAPVDRGPRAVVAFETVAYPASHPSPGRLPNVYCPKDCQDAYHNFLYSLGFRLFGNGQPTVPPPSPAAASQPGIPLTPSREPVLRVAPPLS